MPSRVVHAVSGSGYGAGWGMGGWVYLVGNTGTYRPRAEEPTPGHYSEAGPGSPCRGLEWVVMSVRGWAGPVPTLRARSGPRTLPGTGPLEPP